MTSWVERLEARLAAVYVAAHERMVDGKLVHVDSYTRDVIPSPKALREVKEVFEAREGAFPGRPSAAAVTKSVRRLLDRPDVRVKISVDDEDAVAILERGRYLPATEESADPPPYLGSERESLRHLYAYGSDPTPVYGYLSEDRSKVVFGTTQFVLKPDVKKRTAVYFGDSVLSRSATEPQAAMFYDEADYRAVPPGLAQGNEVVTARSVDAIDPYVEAQVHGGVEVDDIEKVIVPPLFTESQLEDIFTLQGPRGRDSYYRRQIARVALRKRLDDLHIPWEEK